MRKREKRNLFVESTVPVKSSSGEESAVLVSRDELGELTVPVLVFVVVACLFSNQLVVF